MMNIYRVNTGEIREYRTSRPRSRDFVTYGLFAVLAFWMLALPSAHAEGTKQLSPIVAGDTSIVMLNTNADSTGRFAAYDAPLVSRLHIRIKDFNTETIYLGLSREYDDFGNPDGIGGTGAYCFRIKDPNGTVVHGPFSMNSGNANADSWELAVNGPDVLDPIDGYSTADAFASFMPTMNGDYYIEFTDNPTNCSVAAPGNPINLKFFDITVVGGGMEQPGRLWSYKWAFVSPPINPNMPPECQFDRPFDGALYSYTTDGFVSLIDFNGSGFQGLQFTVAFGERGPSNMGDVLLDRKSVYNADSTANAADHMVFVNEPDAMEFPSSDNVCGEAELINVQCIGETFCFNIGVTEAGQIEVILDFDGDGEFTEDSIDVILAMIFEEADTACLFWDGLRGDSTQVPFGEPVPAIIRYSQGVQHYAAYDVELLKYGFCVQTIRPICPGFSTDLLYWDDSNLIDDLGTPLYDESDPGTGQPLVQLNGCQCGVDGCRTWTNVHVDADTSCVGQITGYGDRSTLNTWWFASTTLIGPLDLPFVQVTIMGDSVICFGDSTEFLAIGTPDTIDYVYEWTGPNGFMASTQSTGLVADPGVYFVTIIDTAANCMAMDSVLLVVNDAPETMITFTCVGPNQQNADIDLTVTGDAAPFMFLWSNSAMTEDLFDVPPGEYSVMVTDTNGCVAFDTVFVSGCCVLDIVCPSEDGGQFACLDDLPAPDTTLILVNDFCEPLSIVSFDMEISGEASGCVGDTIVMQRLYAVSDGAGNTAACFQFFRIVDDVAPTISCPADVTLDCDAGTDPAVTGLPTVSDNCTAEGDLVVTYSDSGVPGMCAGDPAIERTWIVTDACGNTASCVQLISLQDDEPPLLVPGTCPQDTTIDCGATPMELTPPQYTNNCTNPEFLILTFRDDSLGFDGSCNNQIVGAIIRTYFAEDFCGNVDSSCVLTVNVQDTVAPVFTTPGDVTIDCTEDSSPANTGDVTDAVDDCTIAIVSFEDVVVPGECPVLDTIFRTWTATDVCGNSSTGVQQIIRFDLDPPTFTLPADITIECDESTDPSNTGEITDAVDACDNGVIIEFDDESVAGGCDGESVISRTWIVSDSCGNSSSGLQLITLIDTQGPSFEVPADTIVDCDTDLALADLGTPSSISDNCSSSFNVTYSDDSEPGECPATEVVSRTWIVSDDCGNTSVQVQTITLVDTIAPTLLSCPEDVVFDCAAPSDTLGLPTYLDACSMVVITFRDDSIGFDPPGGLGMILRTFFGTDACGNVDSSCVQTITIQDTIPPEVLTCPADILVDCPIDADTAFTGVPTYSDNCFAVEDLTLTFVDDTVAVGNGCTDVTITRTFYIADPEGNVDSSCVQVIAVVDDIAPLITCPPGLTVSCASLVPAPDVALVTTSDNCDGTVTVTHVGDVITGQTCPNRFTVSRTYRATDVCGNTAECIQLIVVNDVTPPTIACPANVTVSCAANVPAVNTGAVTTSDNCGGTVTVTHISDVITGQTCLNRFTVNRTYRATDVCGNSADCVQLIVVNDVTPPVIACPADITIDDPENTSPDLTGTPTVTDNCAGSVDVAFTDNLIPGDCPEQFVIERTWVATDACANTASCMQIITSDFACGCDLICPDDITVNLLPGQCSAIISYPDPTFDGGGCPMDIFIPTSLTQNTNTTLIQDALACTGIGDSHWRAYDLAALGVTQDYEMSSLGMASWSAGTVQVFVYSYTGPMPPAANLDVSQMTLLGQSAPQAVGAFALSTVPLTAPVTIPAGTNIAVEQRILAGGPWCVAANYAGNSQPGYLQAPPCGFAAPTSYASIGFGFIHPIQVLNGAITQVGAVIVQVSGLPSGSAFPIGTTTNCFELINGATGEVVDSCCFDITVNEYPFSIQPSCNNNVNISLDENCEAQICADVILEGGPYGCYDHYIVNVDQYGPDVNVNCVSLPYSLGIHTVTITDPETGVSCWGQFTIEDKLPPILECQDYTITCGQSLDPVFTPPIMGVSTCSQFPGLPIGMAAPGNITTSTCTVSLPAGVEIVDVNVCVKITHTWIGDCYVQLVSPSGAVTDLWGFGQCGPTQGMHQKFDDDGPQVVLCADINNGCDFLLQPVATQLGTPSLDQYIGDNPNGTWTLMVTDIFPPADNGTLDEWHLEIQYEQNAPFAPNVSDNCGDVTLVYTDVESGDLCSGTQQVVRTWTATDPSGNSSQCVQTLTIEPQTLAALQFPENYIGECGTSSHPSVTGWPTLDGIPLSDGFLCNIFHTWEDKELADCGNGTKIVRTWTVLDWCTLEIIEDIQLIKLSDEQAPIITCPANVTVGTNPWFCYQHVNLAIPQVFDLCGTPFTLNANVSAGTLIHFGGNNYRVDQLPLGTHIVTWTASDACGNSSTCTYTITVVDNIPPTPICDAHTVVALVNEDALGKGLTKIFAETFDDGSHDNCGPVTFLVRRMTSCIDFDWIGPNGEYPFSDGIVGALDRGLTFQPWVPFACCDAGAGAPNSGIPPVMVELRVTDQYGNINSCMVEVIVQDKLAPFIECPPNITVSCEFWFDAQETNGFQPVDGLEEIFGRVLDAYDHEDSDRRNIIIHDPGNNQLPQPYNWGRDGWADDNCDAIIDVRTLIYEDCSGDDLPGVPPANAVRLIERTWRARDAQGNTSTCRQLIWVVDYKPFFITDQTCFNANPNDGVIWPCDRLFTNCPEVLPIDYPVIFDDNCSVIGVNYEDQVFHFVDGACLKIIRTWTVIDWCQFNPFTLAGYWQYQQVIKVNDHTGPAFQDCPTAPITLCVEDANVELPSNNQVFLGEDDPNSSSCSVHVWMEHTVHELCSDEVIYDVKIYPYNGTEFIQIVTPRSVPVNDENNAVITFDTRQNSLPANHPVRRYGLPYNDRFCSNYPFPGGTKEYHRVLWTVEDGCGNITTCSYLFRLEDCKQPTPVCHGLSTVVMPIGGTVTIWAKDFDASSFDDCTSNADLLFSFSGDTFQPGQEFDCDAIKDNGSPTFIVQIWVADEGNDQNCDGVISWNERNKDFCTTFIVIDDNDNCPGGVGVGGTIETELTEAVENVIVNLNDPTGQIMSTYVTDKDGHYRFTNPLIDYVVKPGRNDNHKNGVSTLDLVEIQKHLLGLKLLDSPYKLIAADANNSGSVSTLDLVEIRKLILGLYTEYPKNTSWRFVPANFEFDDPTHPWPFAEQLTLYSGMTMHEDFVAIKVGDVNGTVQANAAQVITRGANQALQLQIMDQQVDAGELVEVPVYAESFDDILGFQMTLETPGLEYVGVVSGLLQMPEDFIAPHAGSVTMSWMQFTTTGRVHTAEGEPLFILRFVATADGAVSKMLYVSSAITEAEAYRAGEEVEYLEINLGVKRAVADQLEYALYQNEPNPFSDQTVIGFDLPGSMSATLTLYDMSGRMVRRIEGDYAEGYNTIVLKSTELSMGGAYYYRLDAGDFTASKKLILVRSRE